MNFQSADFYNEDVQDEDKYLLELTAHHCNEQIAYFSKKEDDEQNEDENLPDEQDCKPPTPSSSLPPSSETLPPRRKQKAKANEAESEEENLFKIFEVGDDDPEPATKKPRTKAVASPVAATNRGRELRHYLFAVFGGYRDGRQKNRDKIGAIKVDDEGTHNDYYQYFCRISVRVPDSEDGTFELELCNPPLNVEVEELVKEHGGKVKRSQCDPLDTSIKMTLNLDQRDFLAELAAEIRRIVGRKRRRDYHVKAWCKVAPRTSDSLLRLKHYLSGFSKGYRAWPSP